MPVEHLPQSMVLKQGAIIEIPLINKEDVHSISGYQREEPKSKKQKNDTDEKYLSGMNNDARRQSSFVFEHLQIKLTYLYSERKPLI